jgi:mannose-6-phosphate isomerase
MGLDDKPRELHVAQSLESIDFNDFEPGMDKPEGDTLASCAYFRTERKSLFPGQMIGNPVPGKFSILSIVQGALESPQGRRFEKGRFLLSPRDAAPLSALENTTVLQVTLP